MQWQKPKNAVILCHGYGGDGKDISILASYWRAHLPDTIIICPDAPEKCAASPTGFQWFDLMDQSPEQILSKSLGMVILGIERLMLSIVGIALFSEPLIL